MKTKNAASKPLDILVVEDNDRHQKSAQALLAGHNVTIVDGFDYAMDLLADKTEWKLKPGADPNMGNSHEKIIIPAKRYDVLLSDLMFPQGRGVMQGTEGKMLAYDPMAFGFPLAIIAGRAGIEHIAVVTDMNHHSHPMAYTFDHLKDEDPEKGWRRVARIPIAGATVMFFDERDLPSAYALKNGKFSTESTRQLLPLSKVQFPEDLETDYARHEEAASKEFPDGIAYVRKESSYAVLKGSGDYKYPEHSKNWKGALERLLKGEPESWGDL